MLKQLLLIISFLLITACTASAPIDFPEASETPASPDLADFVPEAGTFIQELFLDLDGDGTDERVIHYKSEDGYPNGQLALTDHVEIYKQLEGWELVQSFEYANESYEKGDEEPVPTLPRRVRKLHATDIGSDGTLELFLSDEATLLDEWHLFYYRIIGFDGEEIKELTIPRGFDGVTPGMRPQDTGQFYGMLMEVRLENGTVVEHWGGLCEGSEKPCYFFDFVISYDSELGEWSISRAVNASLDEEEYQAWLERFEYEDNWTGEVPFGIPREE